MPGAEDDFVIKDNLGILIDNSAEAIEADPKRKHMIISSVKEDFINHDLLPGSTHNVERLPGKIAIKYNLPLPIANEVAGHVMTDSRSVIDHEPVLDTVFIYRKKECSPTDNMKLNEKDKLIFNRVVHSLQNHDSHYAKILSNELSQIRKMTKMVDSAKIAFEQIQLRLNTITELGDVVVTLSPAMSVIKGIQGGLSSMMPQADQSFGQISDLLGNIMTESGQITATAAPTEIITGTQLNEEAMKIIEEASAIIEDNTKSKFPDLPPLSEENDRVKSSSSSKARQTSSL